METNTELKMIHLSEIESQQIKWLWYPFIPYGKLSIVQGDPGDGKSTLILNIAAKLSMGEGCKIYRTCDVAVLKRKDNYDDII